MSSAEAPENKSVEVCSRAAGLPALPLSRLLFLLLPFLALFLAGGATAQPYPDSPTYPDHPVRIIVPIGPGGAYDIIGRLLANRLSEQTGQTFFVENRTGAGTLVGTQAAAAAPADGYTLVIGGLSNLVFNFALYQKVPYEPDDFVPVAVVYSFPYVMVAGNHLPQKDLAEIISYGRQSPGKLTVAHPGSGSGQQIIAAAFMKQTATTIVEVPYRSAQAAYPDLMAGRVDLFFDSVTGALPYLRAQKVRGIALLAHQRYVKLPDLPTIAEAGLTGLSVQSWIGLFAPARTPPEILGRLRQETRIAAVGLKNQFERGGGALMQMPVGETDRFIRSEFDVWTRVIRDARIRFD
jgi:tripartite-type tricarboxylate transporter receptor subunit TctC